MAAGLAGLSEVFTPEAADALNDAGDRLRRRLNDAARRQGAPALVTGVGSILCMHFQHRPVTKPADAAATPPAARKLFQLEMNLAGFYLARRGFMSLSLALTEADCDAYVAAFEGFLDTYGAVLGE